MRGNISPSLFRNIGFLIAGVGVILLIDQKWSGGITLFVIACVDFALWALQRRRLGK